MSLKKRTIICPVLLLSIILAIFTSCSLQNENYQEGSAISSGGTESNSASYAHNVSSRNIIDSEEDEIDTLTITQSFNIDFDNFSDIEEDGISITKNDYGLEISSTIEGVVELNLSGELTGTFTISETEDSKTSAFIINLNGVEIKSSYGPCLNLLQDNTKYFVIAKEDTTNTLIDNSSKDNRKTSTYTEKGAIYCASTLIFSGTGNIELESNYKHCILCDDYIRVLEGNINITTSTGDGIRAVSGFIFDDGILSIVANYDSEAGDESKGIRVKGEESTEYCGEGFIVIKNGKIEITSVGKAITANWDPDEDDDGESSNNPDPYVSILGGEIIITTSGTPYEYTEDGETISLSPEGIEGKSYVLIEDGDINILSTDDCINAGEKITINGGSIYCKSTKNDAIDSNGMLSINGGVIVAIATTVPECAFDCDSYVFEINGGILVGLGTSNYSVPTSSYCTQNALVISSSIANANSTMSIVDENSQTIFAYTIPCSYDVMILSSPKLQNNTVYTIYNGVSPSSQGFNGLYYDNITTIGGSIGTSFTVSDSTVTGLGSVTSGGAMEGVPGARTF